MNDAALKPDTQDVVVDEVFPHTPETIWKTLTTANLMGRWLMMPAGFSCWVVMGIRVHICLTNSASRASSATRTTMDGLTIPPTVR